VMCGGSILSYCSHNLHGHERALKEEEVLRQSKVVNQTDLVVFGRRLITISELIKAQK